MINHDPGGISNTCLTRLWCRALSLNGVVELVSKERAIPPLGEMAERAFYLTIAEFMD
jgi:hypothetical protein